MIQVVDAIVRTLIEALVITCIIRRYLVPIQNRKSLGTLYLVLTYTLHCVFWIFSYSIESIPLKCFEYYLYYVVSWMIIDYFFEGDGFVNFIFVYATVFTYRIGEFGFLYMVTGVFCQFDSSKFIIFREKTAPIAYVYYILMVIIGFFVAWLLVDIYKRLKGWKSFVVIAIFAGIQMIAEIVMSAETVYIVIPDVILYLVLGLLMQRRELNKQDKAKLRYRQLEEKQKKQQEELAKLRHDLANHISVVDNLSKEKDSKEILIKIDKEIRTGSSIIDCLFEEKEKKCKQENIALTASYIDLSENCVSNFDWIGLFANLLDNAIEACSKVEGKKQITYTMERKNDYFLFTISNSKSEKFKPLKDNFITTKSDISHHGYGTQIIRDITRKYDGRIRYEDCRCEMKAHVILLAWKD